MDGASKATLENEFGTKNEDEAIIQILEKGDIQNVEVGARTPNTATQQPLTYSHRIYPTTQVEEDKETKLKVVDKRSRENGSKHDNHPGYGFSKYSPRLAVRRLIGNLTEAREAQRPELI